ncbi:MAG TPA: hypothetical protein VFX77_02640, partial [Rubrobacter sp.]|nr:hypothetical protein [Rubrobacter sp.]
VVGTGALRLEYRAELRNRGAEEATVRAWRWCVADAWDRSYYYLPLEIRMELARVGEERKERRLEEGEEGEAFTMPAGGFAPLRFEGLYVVVKGEPEGGPEGCAPRFGASFRGARLHRDGGGAPRGEGDHGARGGAGSLLAAPKVSRSAAGGWLKRGRMR